MHSIFLIHRSYLNCSSVPITALFVFRVNLSKPIKLSRKDIALFAKPCRRSSLISHCLTPDGGRNFSTFLYKVLLITVISITLSLVIIVLCVMHLTQANICHSRLHQYLLSCLSVNQFKQTQGQNTIIFVASGCYFRFLITKGRRRKLCIYGPKTFRHTNFPLSSHQPWQQQQRTHTQLTHIS